MATPYMDIILISFRSSGAMFNLQTNKLLQTNFPDVNFVLMLERSAREIYRLQLAWND